MARKLVSVALSRVDFERIANAAHREGNYISAFMREAALTKRTVCEVSFSLPEGSKLYLYSGAPQVSVSYGTPVTWIPDALN